MNYSHEISSETLAAVTEDLPELLTIKNEELRERAIRAWGFSITNSSFSRISDIPGAANPDQVILIKGNQATHLRGVASIAMSLVDEFQTRFPDAPVNRDIVLAGALCHDIGKPWEFDPENRRRWVEDPSSTGSPSMRHSVYGAHICLTMGLPEEIAHIAIGHSLEAQYIGLSTECTIVRTADHAWWYVAIALGLVEPGTEKIMPGYIRPRLSGVAPS